MSPDEFYGLIEADGNDTLIVGEWQMLPDVVFRGLHRARKGRPRYPSADVLLEIVEMRAAHDDFAGTEDLQPIYLREPDVQINWSDFREEGLWPGAAS